MRRSFSAVNAAALATSAVFASALLASPGMNGQAFGQQSLDGVPSVEELVQGLAPKKKKPLTRSFVPGGLTRGIEIEESDAIPDAPRPTVNINIQFEYDASSLTNDGILAIEALGAAMQDPRLRTQQFEIVGHTDARGAELYNRDLSERRAQTVMMRLIQFHNINPSRLKAYGVGESQPLDPGQPEAAVNRRVQIVTIIDGLS